MELKQTIDWKENQPFYKFQGNNYPEAIQKDEIVKLGNTEEILRDQYRRLRAMGQMMLDKEDYCQEFRWIN